MTDYVLTLNCPDRVGVVSDVAQLLSNANAFITDISQYSDADSRWFFSRTVFDDREMNNGLSEFVCSMQKLANAFDMTYVLRPIQRQPKVLIAVSQYDHCLNVLLTKWQAGALPIEIVGVVSNHQTCQPIADFYQVPFHHLPLDKDNKLRQEARLEQIMTNDNVDVLVLARYMQILSADFCARHEARVINIHHSFLPGFKGARPYHQAHARGVKVIGATAHYVTSDLDEGPIIAQEVKPIDHRVTVPQMVHIGQDLEATALSHALKLHAEERVVINGMRTVTL